MVMVGPAARMDAAVIPSPRTRTSASGLLLIMNKLLRISSIPGRLCGKVRAIISETGSTSSGTRAKVGDHEDQHALDSLALQRGPASR